MPPMTLEALKAMVNEQVGSALAPIDERIKAAAAAQEGQAKNFGAMIAGAVNQKAASNDPKKKGLFAAKAIMAMAGAALASKGGRGVTPEAWAAEKYGKDDEVTKALSATTGAQGAFLVQEQQATEVIEFLRPNSAIRKLNPVIAPMSEGNLTLPKLTGGASGGYIGENANLPKSEQTFGQVKANARKLGVLVPISNDLIRRAAPGTDSMVRDDMVAALAQRSDLAFLRGDGSQYTPKGLKNWCLSANVIPANASVSLANTITDLGKLIVALANANVRFIRPGWVFAPRTWNYLMNLITANGQYVFRNELLNGTLWGWPWQMTTQIPTNLGSGSDSEIYIADFADVIVAEATQLLVDVSTEAAYYDGSAVVAAFSQDQTVIRAILEHDLVMRHDESVAMLSGVTWA